MGIKNAYGLELQMSREWRMWNREWRMGNGTAKIFLVFIVNFYAHFYSFWGAPMREIKSFLGALQSATLAMCATYRPAKVIQKPH